MGILHQPPGHAVHRRRASSTDTHISELRFQLTGSKLPTRLSEGLPRSLPER